MTPDAIGKLEEAFANGATDEQACFYANIHKTTLYEYQTRHPEFKDRKHGLKSHLQLIAKNNIAREIKDGSVPQSNWLLERKEKGEYSARQEGKIGFEPLVIDHTIKLTPGEAYLRIIEGREV